MTDTPTILLHDVRAFLARHGHDVPAWSSTSAPLEALFALLAERREDEAFWRDLASLVARIDDTHVRPRVLAGAVGAHEVQRLVRDLRAELPAASDPPRTMRAWARTLGVTALTAFFVLGAAMGCEPFDPDSAECDAAIEFEIPQDEQTVFCELVEIVEDASPAQWVVDTLMECIPTLAEDDREDLLDEFVNASEDDLADLLFDLATSPDCDDDWDDNYNDH
jgi:hypothetical protein